MVFYIKMKNSITAVITTFNRKDFLRQALSSVLEQTYNQIQIIVMDNSSSDGTQEYMRQIRDTRIHYIRHEAIGIAEQRNLGIKHASGKYVGFLDDDDRWLPDKIQLQMAAFKNSTRETALVYGGFEFYDDEGKKWGANTQKIMKDYYNNLLWARDPFTGSASNPLLKKESVLAVGGYNERIKVGEDWELYLRLAFKYPLIKIPRKLLEIRQHTGRRLGDQLKSALKTETYVYRQHSRHMSRALRSRYDQRIGGKLIRLSKRKYGRVMLKNAIKNNQFNLMAWFQLILSYTPYSIYNFIHRTYIKHFKRW